MYLMSQLLKHSVKTKKKKATAKKTGICYILFRPITGSNKIDLTFNWCNHATVGSIEVYYILSM